MAAAVMTVSAVDPHNYCPGVRTLPDPTAACSGSFSLRSAAAESRMRGGGGGGVALRRRACSVHLRSSFLGSWPSVSAAVSTGGTRRRRRGAGSRRSSSHGGFTVVADLGGQYEVGFDDVHQQLVNFFTYKAVRTVLHQLYEMNPPNYMWFYNFVANNEVSNGKTFLRKLAKEKQDLAERVMVTRLHLYGKWIKKCDHAKMYQFISDENLELMRERLIETVIWPSDDPNAEKVSD